MSAEVQEKSILSKVLAMLLGDKLPANALADHIQNIDALSVRIAEARVVLNK